jgi:predicted nucleic acid-binding protein
MRLVVADTSPIFYLLSIGQIELLPRLFGKVFVPDAVDDELRHPTAPAVLQEWIAERPSWLEAARCRGESRDYARVINECGSDFDR